ncbi:DUF2777 domain-containing protein [Bacillus sp. FJAT-29790]|uniref:DUF2777 domain-containing protein n=1 Tax=Bacillus sp. FJAT-29790 TaxID=1895002 RepID=UPI001C220E7A|nr:DUF2777 domain-containing protein [Bacillus sp. FJAT-29790]MBU8877422.1 DUF2777 domain-containing protein [Bacillus sp. FJAT-29790]
MNRQQRMKLIEYQNRAFTEGTIEFINNQWVFFDKETEEASLLDEFLHQEIELFRFKRWKKGILFEDGKLAFSDEIFHLKDQDSVRIRKLLVFSLEKLLDEMNDDAFFQFITTLNSLQFSVYDCIYCYNQLSFLDASERKSGVNFIVFDNQEHICNVQHHFSYFEKTNDRFEFTLNSGKRMIIEKISS